MRIINDTYILERIYEFNDKEEYENSLDMLNNNGFTPCEDLYKVGDKLYCKFIRLELGCVSYE